MKAIKQNVTFRLLVIGSSVLLVLFPVAALRENAGGFRRNIGEYLRTEFTSVFQKNFLPLLAYEQEKNETCIDRAVGFILPLLKKESLRPANAPGDRLTVEEQEMLQSEPNFTAEEEGILAALEREQQSARVGEDADMPEREAVFPEPEGQEASTNWYGHFIPHAKEKDLAVTELTDYETLLKTFYTVDPSTMTGSNQLDATVFLEKDLTIDKKTDGPQILIYHTHSQEAFADSDGSDSSTTIVGVGEELTKMLTENYGYQVLHHTAEYDKKTRTDAYSRALPDIEKILEDNPTIQVVIDLHRDEMPEGTRLVTEIDGEKTAKIMFFNGLSRTKKTGNLDYLYNVYQEDNLAFSFQMEKAAMEYYPGLTRKIYLKGYRYNMHVCPKTLLIELGAQNNTLQEAMNACGPLAHILDLVLGGEL